MAGTDVMIFLLPELGFWIPSLIVYGVAFVLALVYRRRAPRASTLTLAGVGVLIFTMFVNIAGSAYLIHSMGTAQSWEGYVGTRQKVGIIDFAATCVRAVGLLLLVLAIFAGRGPSVRQQRASGAPPEEDEPRRVNGGEAGQFRERRGP